MHPVVSSDLERIADLAKTARVLARSGEERLLHSTLDEIERLATSWSPVPA